MREWLAGLKDRMQALLEEFGTVALGTYVVIALVVYVGFVAALRMGFEVEGTAAAAGTLGAAWVGLKLTQPFRILATLALTPPVAIAMRRRRERVPEEFPEES